MPPTMHAYTNSHTHARSTHKPMYIVIPTCKDIPTGKGTYVHKYAHNTHVLKLIFFYTKHYI